MLDNQHVGEILDKHSLRKAASAVGIMLILFFAFLYVAEIFIVVVFNLIMNKNLPLNFDELKKAYYFFYYYSENMGMISNELCQLVSLSLSVFCVSLVYKFKPLSIIKSKKVEQDFFDENFHSKKYENKKRRKSICKLILIVSPIVIMINFFTAILINTIIAIIERLGTKVPSVNFDFKNRTSSLIVYFLALCVSAPIIEEFLLRGCVIKILKPYGDWFAIVVSAFFFGLIHGNMGQGFGAFFIGLLFGFVAIKTGSIIPTIILHSLNNFSSYLGSVTSNMSENHVANNSFTSIYLLIVLIGIILIIINANKFKLDNNNIVCLSKNKIYAIFFLNIFVVIYVAYEIYRFIYSFSQV